MNNVELVSFYTEQLNDKFISYWTEKMDMEYGGVFSCISNVDDNIISTRKYIWSQGRFLWMASRLLQMADQYQLEIPSQWQTHAALTYQFLSNHAKLDNGNIVNAVEKNGDKIKEELDVSIFADCFYTIGAAAYASYSGDKAAWSDALAVYERTKERIAVGDYKSDPYPIPEGFDSHSIPMILINVAEELYQVAVKFQDEKAPALAADVKRYFARIIEDHVRGKRLVEFLPQTNKKYSENTTASNWSTMLARHVNPGHTLECIWFLYDALHHFSKEERRNYRVLLQKLALFALEKGWDQQYGGLLRYIDFEGGQPTGVESGQPMEQLITSTWDSKLWWPHSEALYTTLLFATRLEREGNEQAAVFQMWYDRLHEYVFRVFPAESGQEWTQIRSRDGEPVDKVVALPVKDPFHIVRNFLLCIRLLRGESVWK